MVIAKRERRKGYRFYNFLITGIQLILVLILNLGVDLSFANPLLNINTENQVLYDNTEASSLSYVNSNTIQPMSYYKIAPFIDNVKRTIPEIETISDIAYYIKPLHGINGRFYFTNEENTFLEGQSGLKLQKGVNFFLFEEGYLSLGQSFVFYCQLKQSNNSDETTFELFRTYAKFLLGKVSLEVGKDNVNLGPGEYGLLLSDNVEPYPLIKLQTEDYLKFLGKWDFLFLHGWLLEEREDVSNPKIFAIRIVWKPFDFLELGCTKINMFGGRGQPGYSIVDYPAIIAEYKRDDVEEDNSEEKFDTEAFVGYDISINLPISKLISIVKAVRLYFQEAATDMNAPWIKSDEYKKKFKLLNRAYQTGIFLSTQKNIFRLEYAVTDYSFYLHSLYNVEGFTYKGLSLGYPFGRNMESIFFKHRYYFNNMFSFEYKIGRYQLPLFEGEDDNRKIGDLMLPSTDAEEKMVRDYISLSADLRIEDLYVNTYVKIEKTDNYDDNFLPTQFNIVDEDKIFQTFGVSIIYKF